MIKRPSSSWSDRIKANWNYKILSFLVAVVLWISVIGQREAKIRYDFSLNFLTSPNQTVTESSVDFVQVELAGAPVRLKKLKSQILSLDIDLRNKTGEQLVKLNEDRFDLPIGVKVLSIRPSSIKTHLENQPLSGEEQ